MFDDIAGRRETETFIPSRLREDQGVDAHEPACHVYERVAAVSRIDGGVGLNEDHRVVGPELAIDRTDDTQRNRVLKPQRAPEGHDKLSLPQLIRVAELEEGESASSDLQNG